MRAIESSNVKRAVEPLPSMRAGFPRSRAVRCSAVRCGAVRCGGVTLLATMLIVVGVVMAVLITDASYLLAVNRGMQHVSSIMALAAAPELLDPHLLQDAAGPPVPDQTAARTVAAQVADRYRDRNNSVIPSLQRVDATDVVIQTGFVDDLTAKPPYLDPLPVEHNTVFVYAARTTDGAHPVTYPVGLSGTTQSIEIRGGAYATLDNLVVGFRPEAAMPAPLLPLGIMTASWNSERTSDGNGNGINEMVVRLRSAAPPNHPQYPPEPNGALLFYGGTFSPEVLSQTLPQQSVQGLFPSDLPPNGQIGPATSAVLLPVLGTPMADGADPGTVAIVAALNSIVGQKRVFPLVQQITGVAPNGTGSAQVEGYVACTILGAAIIDNRLTVRVEPCFLIHHTAWTTALSAIDAPVGLQRNLYIYKLRLSR